MRTFVDVPLQAGVDARMRMQLEKVVEELESQPMNKEVPAEHLTAYKYIRALAQEITSITQANVRPPPCLDLLGFPSNACLRHQASRSQDVCAVAFMHGVASGTMSAASADVFLRQSSPPDWVDCIGAWSAGLKRGAF